MTDRTESKAPLLELRKAAQDVVDAFQYEGSFYTSYRQEKIETLRSTLAAPAPDAGEDDLSEFLTRALQRAASEISALEAERDALRTKLAEADRVIEAWRSYDLQQASLTDESDNSLGEIDLLTDRLRGARRLTHEYRKP